MVEWIQAAAMLMLTGGLMLALYRTAGLCREADRLRQAHREMTFRLDILRKELDQRQLTFEETIETDQWRQETAFAPGEELW